MTVTVNALLEACALELGLRWCAGRSGGDRIIECTNGSVPLMGVYNPWKKQQITILGDQELERIEPAVYPEESQTAGLFHEKALLIVLASGCRAPAFLTEQADAAGIALMATRLGEEGLLLLLYRRMSSLCAPHRHVHGVLLSVAGIGTLILGAEGVGKSSLALELLGRGHRLIVDDDVDLCRDADGRLWGRNGSAEQLHGYLFVRGLGMVDVAAEFGAFAMAARAELEQVIRLVGPQADANTMVIDSPELEGSQTWEQLLGVRLPSLRIGPCCSAADRVEAYTRRRQLAARGYDAPAVFRARLAEAQTSERIR